MAVPRMTQLYPGISVNIILKADQPTGRLTTGSIADILTRGDHPRGIKVRLSNGKIGRVQSLASAQSTTTGNAVEPAALNTTNDIKTSGHGRRSIQEDYRNEEQPEVESSLLDYIRIKPARKSKAKTKASKNEEPAVPLQHQLESEFPKLDSALIAAILVDNENIEEARNVLSTLG